MEVGFEPEYQDGADSYASDNALFEQYDNAISVNIVLYGAQELTVYSAPATVGELLSGLSVTLGKDDVSSVELDAQIEEGMTVKIDRIVVKERVEKEDVPYTSTTVETKSLNKGVTRVKQAGVTGEITRIYTETYVNGKMISSELTSEETTVQVVDEIIEKGTYVEPPKQTKKESVKEEKTTDGSIPTHKVSTPQIRGTEIPDADGKGGTYIDENGNSYRYLYYIDCVATAYGYESGMLTATGLRVGKGKMAVDPRLIPYHTRCYVTGSYGDMGVQVAEDCGNFRGNWIDLFLGSDYVCRQFGKRPMRVYILA
ncbi:MAG: G5 domain-containing protein [Clostridia bacterium]|nr:G5 domain-containing protein [Clostridia bacterium]